MSKIVYLYVKPLFLYYFLLIATMTKAMFANSQQFLIITLFLCEVITLHKINMISLFLFILSFSFIPSRSKWDDQALDSTLIFIIYSSRTWLHRGIIRQGSKLNHTKNFILLDQDITKRIELRKAIKIKMWWWYDTGAPPPSLAVAKGSAHTHVIMSPSSELVLWSSWRWCPSGYDNPSRAY